MKEWLGIIGILATPVVLLFGLVSIGYEPYPELNTVDTIEEVRQADIQLLKSSLPSTTTPVKEEIKQTPETEISVYDICENTIQCTYEGTRTCFKPEGYVFSFCETEYEPVEIPSPVVQPSYNSYYSAPKANTAVRTGAICKDGWRSYSTGSGTCSHHGGVRTWTY